MAATEQQSLAFRLRNRRHALMLSQSEAAAAIGVSRRIYQAWEQGTVTSPQPRKRRRIEAWLMEGSA